MLKFRLEKVQKGAADINVNLVRTIMKQQLESTIKQMAEKGRGILAADESSNTIKKRFDTIQLASTEENHRAYREMLFTTPQLEEFISGVILYEETLKQSTKKGVPFAKWLNDIGIVPGIKVDLGLIPLVSSPNEKVTQGLDGLPERLAEYKTLGARFAKWRAVFDIDAIRPTMLAIQANVYNLAHYAAICQSLGIVPIVEPELLMDGEHTIERCEEASLQVFHAVFRALDLFKVTLENMVLKPSMVISGKNCSKQADVEKVAYLTLRTLLRTVPAAVPSINFLSGGQSSELATAHLDAMNKQFPNAPWNLSFSYGRALQDHALKTWGGKSDNVKAAQAALYKRAKLNAAASIGKYSQSLEKAA